MCFNLLVCKNKYTDCSLKKNRLLEQALPEKVLEAEFLLILWLVVKTFFQELPGNSAQCQVCDEYLRPARLRGLSIFSRDAPVTQGAVANPVFSGITYIVRSRV